jgi:hypothetical protein
LKDRDPCGSELETLLSLDRELYPMDNGCWIKIEARRVEPGKHVQHGIKYSLTLHDRNNTRIFGIDNAHGIKPKRKKFAGRKTTWDHKHEENKVVPYEFESAGQLLNDFWEEVDRILNEIKR